MQATFVKDNVWLRMGRKSDNLRYLLLFRRSENFPSYSLLFEHSENPTPKGSGQAFLDARYCSSGSENYPMVPSISDDGLPRRSRRGSRRAAPRTVKVLPPSNRL